MTMKVQCCVCKKIRIDGVWTAPTVSQIGKEQVSHGYCPACADDAFAELRAYHATKRDLPLDSTFAA